MLRIIRNLSWEFFRVANSSYHLAPNYIPSFEITRDWTNVCSLITGTHWVWEITRMLVKGSTDYEQKSKETVTNEFHLPEEFDTMPSPRIFNTHLPFRHLPRDMKNKRCKMIFVQRNPKDVAVSFFHHTKNFDYLFYNGDWDHYFKLFVSERGNFSVSHSYF